MFIPMVKRHWAVREEASRIAELLEASPQFRNLHVEGIDRKFVGVIVTGALDSASELELLEDLLGGKRVFPIRLIISVGDKMIERDVRR